MEMEMELATVRIRHLCAAGFLQALAVGVTGCVRANAAVPPEAAECVFVFHHQPGMANDPVPIALAFE
ncbi:hypothetical protein [Planococcus lenghuensis]|uniref:Uncharacterized protein n=1 Tax=Planococcus lenghuensis TaxID=2213202 RepID=A0A1Q2KUF5_9BACL|nr:hypothetical protein [Planococcus lenghuensis]AQQ51821.1 hypothetical protein B0X71_00935 [Planococcus lenghuensis]